MMIRPTRRVRMRWHLSLKQQVGLLAVVIVSFIVAGTLIQRRVARAVDTLFTETALARQQVTAAGDVLDKLQDAETGQRGYLLIQRQAYLEPYLKAVEALPRVLDHLDSLSDTTPWLRDAGAQLRRVALAKAAEMQKMIDLTQGGNLPGALALVATDQGKALMDDARARVAAIADRSSGERVMAADQLRREQRRLNFAMQGALVVGLLLLGGALTLVLLNRTRLLATQTRERQAAGRLKAAIERIRDGIAVFDAGGRIILTNDRMASNLGLGPQLVLLGMRWSQLAAAVALDPPLLDTTLNTQPAATVVKQGPRTLELWRSTMPDGGQILAVADITRRIEAEEIARQAQKMEVLGQMTGGVAHDFNNLLQVISANLELIGNRVERAEVPDPWLRTRLEAARIGVTRGSRLTRHLLAFARRQPLAPEAIDPARALNGMEDMLRRSVTGAIELELIVGGGLWTIRADSNQLENALLNLALNARDAMTQDGRAGGRLTVEAANSSLDDIYAARAAEVIPGQYVMFAVTDTGVGMDKQQLARATEPFYTTKAEGQGTGLGLSMVFGFAKQSGGHFQLYSEPGRGTTARLYLPRTRDKAPPEPPGPALPLAANGELVLVVEDDNLVRATSIEAVRGLGYSVIEADSAEAALALIETGARPAILFSDVVMPGGMTSRVLAERARSLIPGLAVLFTSGYTQNSIVHNGQLDPDITLISKPWRAEELGVQLQAVLARAREPERRTGSARVLLIDPEITTRTTTAGLLAHAGFEVSEATSGLAALHFVNEADVVLVSRTLPDMSGPDWAQRVRSLRPELPVVIAFGPAEAAGEGGVGWLAKPFDGPALIAAIGGALAGGHPQRV